MFSKLLDWLYPPTCIACRTLIALNEAQPRDMLLCHKCQTLFEPIKPPMCNNCGIPTERDVERCVSCFGKTFYFTFARAVFVYDDLVRDLLHDLKFRRKKQIAQSLGKLWATHVKSIPDTIRPVPKREEARENVGIREHFHALEWISGQVYSGSPTPSPKKATGKGL